jgi:predicted aspartyl protease
MGVLGVAGERGVAPMLASDGVDFALMGVAMLELFRLEVDPAASKLEENVAHLL